MPHHSMMATWFICGNKSRGGTRYRMHGNLLCLLLPLHQQRMEAHSLCIERMVRSLQGGFTERSCSCVQLDYLLHKTTQSLRLNSVLIKTRQARTQAVSCCFYSTPGGHQQFHSNALYHALCYFESVMDLFKSYCEICNALRAISELSYPIQSNHAILFVKIPYRLIF